MKLKIAFSLALVITASHVRGTHPKADVEALMPILADLAGRAGYGVMPFERGAFLVKESDGTISCRLWPFTGEFMRTGVQLAMPEGTIAIAHTHPKTAPLASRHDREVASRLGVSMIVVGRNTVQWVGEDGRVVADLPGVVWARHSHPSRRCQPIGRHAERARRAGR